MFESRRVSATPVSHVIAAVLVAAAFAEPAWASKRTPAPIVFNETGSSSRPAATRDTRQAPVRTAQATTAVPASQDRATRRIEFRYPDQPDIYYGEGGPRAGGDVAPMAFASSQAAISPAQAKTFAAIQAPQVLTQPVERDPALTPGAFDARAAAQQIATARQAAVVESAALAAVSSPAEFRVAPETTGQGFEQTGQGIIYDAEYAGLPTANGETLDQTAMTAAHPALPVPSLVRVTNIDTGKEVVLRINDRGPFEDGPVLQVTQRAAEVLGFDGAGRGNLHIRYLGPAPALAAAAPVQREISFARTPAPPAKVAAFQSYLKQDADELLGGNGSTPASASPRPQATLQLPAAASTGDAVYVQLASFSEFGNADALVRRIDSRLQPEIVPARVNGADFFRVRVGPLADRETASGLRDQLAMQGIADGRVVSGH